MYSIPSTGLYELKRLIRDVCSAVNNYHPDRLERANQSGQLLKLNSPHFSPYAFAACATMLIRSLHRAHKAPNSPIWGPSRCRMKVRGWPLQRHFTSSLRTAIAVAEMRKEDLASLRIDQDRLMDTIHSTCEWGTGERWGE